MRVGKKNYCCSLNLKKNIICSFSVLFCFLLFFSSCSTSNQWHVSWPSHTQAIDNTQSVSLIGRGDVFTLMRAKWFSNRLNIPMDSIYPFFSQFADSIIQKTLLASLPSMNTFPEKFNKKFPEETQKLDDKIFIKGHFPPQGVTVTTEDSKTPKYLLLLHEITLGTDLEKRAFFDYSKKQEEIDSKKKPVQVSVILSYTLWDNEKQIPLYSSIIEEQMPVTQSVNLQSISELLQKAVANIPLEILKGAKK